jgi:hypothetical protein
MRGEKIRYGSVEISSSSVDIVEGKRGRNSFGTERKQSDSNAHYCCNFALIIPVFIKDI